ncbi:MAG TPA: tRNA preQ1(34) S-adenosylmethionine ribosyltransferase-isomerase QueA [Rickettsiales bacterium]|nr:tRNA preQ1(34) S-adenosylmethionine ribosyltransferase-isomerase QueA [Rickettsiales bacterium]
MKTALFDFELPPERIATEPVSPRDSARMLVVNHQAFQDSSVLELPDFLQPGNIMVFNNTKVIPARLYGKRGEANIEVTLHKHMGGNSWRVFAKPGKRLRVGDNILFAEDFSARVLEKYESGEVDMLFESENLYTSLERYGTMPLPPYMKRAGQASDKQDYQTIYAQKEGAVAAPTAGLHFTDRLFKKLEEKGVAKAYVTLHVGGGTFLPVKSDDTQGHIMHSEYAEISAETASLLNQARQEGRRIIAVGTTSLRVLESAAKADGTLGAFAGETDIFITPGYRFKAVDVLMTNFHLPCSTLFMLVSAFCGLDTMQAAYRHAIDRKYRFYSYGDACLLIRQALL